MLKTGFKEELSKYLDAYGFNVTNKQLKQFELFYNLLLSENQKYNLTRITSQQEVIVKHFLDSLQSLHFIGANDRVLDIGAGAGFPALPLKIMNETAVFTAIDSVRKKTDFIELVAKELRLTGFNPLHTRAEELAHALESRESFDVVLSRAVARLNTLVEYCLPFVKVGGVVVAFKSQDINDEIEEARVAIKILGGKIREILEYDLDGVVRKLVIIEKIKKTPSIYPRLGNRPRKSPIV